MTKSSPLTFSTQAFLYSPSAVIDIFAQIAHLPWAFLLHSASKNHVNNRFDILVADPIARLTHQHGINTLYLGDQHPIQCQSDPFEWKNMKMWDMDHPRIPTKPKQRSVIIDYSHFISAENEIL